MTQQTIEEASNSLLSTAVYEAELIGGRDERTAALVNLIPFFLQRKDVDSAAELADSIEETFVRDRELGVVAARCIEINDEEYAFQLVEAIEDPNSRNTALERIAIEYAKEGKLDDARKVIDELEYPSEALTEISFQEAKAGDIEKAYQTVSSIGYPKVEIDALERISTLFTTPEDKDFAVGSLLKAVGRVSELELPEQEIDALVSLGTLFSNVDDKANAIQALSDARQKAEELDSVSKDHYLSKVSLAFMQVGSVDLADLSLDGVVDQVKIATCLAGFARTYLNEGEQEDAVDALVEAIAVLKSQPEREIRDSNERMEAFRSIAITFGLSGDYGRANEVLDDLHDPRMNMETRVQLILMEADSADSGDIETLIRSLNDDEFELGAYLSLSDHYAAKGETDASLNALDEAKEIVLTQDSPVLRLSVLPKIISSYGILGKGEIERPLGSQAIEMVREIKGIGTRSEMLAELFRAFEVCAYSLTESDKSELQTIMKTSSW